MTAPAVTSITAAVVPTAPVMPTTVPPAIVKDAAEFPECTATGRPRNGCECERQHRATNEF